MNAVRRVISGAISAVIVVAFLAGMFFLANTESEATKAFMQHVDAFVGVHPVLFYLGMLAAYTVGPVVFFLALLQLLFAVDPEIEDSLSKSGGGYGGWGGGTW